MRKASIACAVSVWLAASPAAAQTPAAESQLVPPPSWAFNDIACAPTLDMEARGKSQKKAQATLRVVGVQDGAYRELLAPPALLVVSGGSNAGLEPGQRYFVRRRVVPLTGLEEIPTVHTSGWVQIVGVDTLVATAEILHACEGILLDDYLEPFTAPTIAARPLPGTVPQFENMGHIVTGVDGAHTGGVGNTMTIDRGTNAGIELGQRFVVFRDKRELNVDTSQASKELAEGTKNAPLVEIGEVLVVSVRPNDATVQITVAKDAISKDDLVAPIR